jgi:DHA1 family bicyclomycin/chloramphenicol resistance-like MFS transporter
MAGEYSAIPLGVIIFATSLLAVFFNAVLIKNGKPVPAPQEINLD